MSQGWSRERHGMSGADLILRRVRPFGGAETDVAIAGGVIVAMGERLALKGPEVDGGGRMLLPGLHDHHIHLMATAAARQSLSLAGVFDGAAVAARVRAAADALPPGGWLRAVDYDERAAGLPDAAMIDGWVADRPVRMLDRTGALWVLNSAALAWIDGQGGWPDGAERDAAGALTGRFWRCDAWLRTRLPAGAGPDLGALSLELARLGVTGVTDTGAGNGPSEAALFEGARARGVLKQRLCLMGREDLPEGMGYARGPLKIIVDERDPPDVDALAARMAAAHGAGRAVAVHCATATELALALAGFGAAGTIAGDRIEHGNVVPEGAVAELRALGLTLCAQPGFIAARGDRWLAQVEAGDQGDLLPLARLAAAGVAMIGGSDGPYGPIDPWAGMRAAVSRRTASGAVMGAGEALSPEAALGLWLAEAEPPFAVREVAVGAAADLILVEGGMADVLGDCDAGRVAMTLIEGRICWSCG
jgi:predicted amidohydrolase YtcJ